MIQFRLCIWGKEKYDVSVYMCADVSVVLHIRGCLVPRGPLLVLLTLLGEAHVYQVFSLCKLPF